MVVRKNISLNAFISLIAILLLGYSIYTTSLLKNAYTQKNGGDTTIVIKQYFDTTIYLTRNKSISIDSSYYYKDFDTSIVVVNGMCDTVRKYSIVDENDSIEIYGDIYTLGILLDRNISYKWKLPYQTTIIKTVTEKHKGLVIGADMLISNNISLGISAGLVTKENIFLHGSYFMDKSIIFGVSKIIDFKKNSNKKVTNSL